MMANDRKGDWRSCTSISVRVAPRAGVWIETCRPHRSSPSAASPPVRGRGLKQFGDRGHCERRVAPRAGRGLKLRGSECRRWAGTMPARFSP